MADFAKGYGRWFFRILTAVCGASAIAWASWVIPVYRQETPFEAPALRILSGEQYGTKQLNELQRLLDGSSGISRPFASANMASIRLRLLERELSSGDQQRLRASIDGFDEALRASLAGDPNASFLWLAEYWLQSVRFGNSASNWELLRMSYALGPNEAWIAVRRNSLALGVFSLLPPDLASRSVKEFVGLLRSGLYDEAAIILAGPGWPIRERLLSELTQVDEGSRRRFAKAVAARNLNEVVVPGIEEPPPSRPY